MSGNKQSIKSNKPVPFEQVLSNVSTFYHSKTKLVLIDQIRKIAKEDGLKLPLLRAYSIPQLEKLNQHIHRLRLDLKRAQAQPMYTLVEGNLASNSTNTTCPSETLQAGIETAKTVKLISKEAWCENTGLTCSPLSMLRNFMPQNIPEDAELVPLTVPSHLSKDDVINFVQTEQPVSDLVLEQNHSLPLVTPKTSAEKKAARSKINAARVTIYKRHQEREALDQLRESQQQLKSSEAGDTLERPPPTVQFNMEEETNLPYDNRSDYCSSEVTHTTMISTGGSIYQVPKDDVPSMSSMYPYPGLSMNGNISSIDELDGNKQNEVVDFVCEQVQQEQQENKTKSYSNVLKTGTDWAS